ncbi:hypothetical protein FIBSPDRAFT_902711 [Athelia psychrophila]|uniref:Uncharacterized protein n=1 Tax=Athelia psychrophila TaxID=1759441 RepID=A0A167WW18_9AGAM|nr:hypothetical protein FIBSPDRAFT_902711 [Fibularhizoctonia sp. CBS 109695]
MLPRWGVFDVAAWAVLSEGLSGTMSVHPGTFVNGHRPVGWSMARHMRQRHPASLHMINMAYHVDGNAGIVTGHYSKRNLEYLVTGDNLHEVFDTRYAGQSGLVHLRHFSRPVAAASLAEQGVNTIFGPTYWPGFVSEPFDSEPRQQDQTQQPPTRLQAYPPPRPSLYPRLRETAVVMANTSGPVAEGPISGSGVLIAFKGLLGAWAWGSLAVERRIRMTGSPESIHSAAFSTITNRCGVGSDFADRSGRHFLSGIVWAMGLMPAYCRTRICLDATSESDSEIEDVPSVPLTPHKVGLSRFEIEAPAYMESDEASIH